MSPASQTKQSHEWALQIVYGSTLKYRLIGQPSARIDETKWIAAKNKPSNFGLGSGKI